MWRVKVADYVGLQITFACSCYDSRHYWSHQLAKPLERSRESQVAGVNVPVLQALNPKP